MEAAVTRGTVPEKLAEEALAQIRPRMAGTVFLVGAGPGDPGLITVKGLETVRKADCIVYDRLSSPELLEETRSDCERIYVGKENHNHTVRQDDINRLLAKKAMEYENVVRLKGGDVYVFGRGGEEALFLSEKGIPFEVVPGVSSCTAGLAYAGIPVTHRGVAGGFHVVTAHDRNDRLADIDFEAMARGRETCVFLMGLSKLPEIVNRLLEAGMPPETGAAVICKATTGEQKVCAAQLGNLPEEAEKADLVSPALIVTGNVVELRKSLDFWDRKALLGKRYLVPKIGTEVCGLTKILRGQGACVKEETVGKIITCEINLERESLSRTDWFVFTSRNGVRAFWENLQNSGLDARCLSAGKFAVIGEKTAEALKTYGICADFVSACHTGKGLADELVNVLSGKEKVCYVRAAQTEDEIEKRLSSQCHLETLAVYRNEMTENAELEPEKVREYDGIFCTCASSAKRLSVRCGEEWGRICRETMFYSIGSRTTECLRKLGAEQITEAAEASYEALAACVYTDIV